MSERTITRKNYLLARTLGRGTHWTLAMEAVSTVALVHPEWDMDELRTWAEWEDEL